MADVSFFQHTTVIDGDERQKLCYRTLKTVRSSITVVISILSGRVLKGMKKSVFRKYDLHKERK